MTFDKAMVECKEHTPSKIIMATIPPQFRCGVCGEKYTGTFNTLSINELNGASEDKVAKEKIE